MRAKRGATPASSSAVFAIETRLAELHWPAEENRDMKKLYNRVPAAQLASLDPHEVPLNFLNPRPGTPFGDLEPMETGDALRTIAAFRLALPRTILRYAGGRELTLGDLGTREGLLGGINAVIVGNYLTTLGRDPREDLALLDELEMPIKALNDTF